MKHPKRNYTVYIMSATKQRRLRFASVAGVRTFLRYRAQRYVGPHRADGFNATFHLDGLTLEQAGYVNRDGRCVEKGLD